MGGLNSGNSTGFLFEKPCVIPRRILAKCSSSEKPVTEVIEIDGDTPPAPESRNIIEEIWSFIDSTNNYINRVQVEHPRAVLTFRLLRAAAIVAREVSSPNAVFGNVYNKSDAFSENFGWLLFWTGLPLYLASGIARDPVGDAHRMFFTFEILCGEQVTSLGTFTPLLLLSIPYLYSSVSHYFLSDSVSSMGIFDGPASQFPDASLCWPVVGKYLNRYILLRIPYYRDLVDALTRSPEESEWFSNLLGGFLVLFLRDLVLWLFEYIKHQF